MNQKSKTDTLIITSYLCIGKVQWAGPSPTRAGLDPRPLPGEDSHCPQQQVHAQVGAQNIEIKRRHLEFEFMFIWCIIPSKRNNKIFPINLKLPETKVTVEKKAKIIRIIRKANLC